MKWDEEWLCERRLESHHQPPYLARCARYFRVYSRTCRATNPQQQCPINISCRTTISLNVIFFFLTCFSPSGFKYMQNIQYFLFYLSMKLLATFLGCRFAVISDRIRHSHSLLQCRAHWIINNWVKIKMNWFCK